MSAGRHVAVVGGNGGIGAALVDALLARDDIAAIHATWRRDEPPQQRDKLTWQRLDATDEAAVADWLGGIQRLDWLINTIGLLHDAEHGPEKSIRQFEPDHFVTSMQTNCLPSLLLAKHATSLLKASDAGVFATVSARVGSIADNGLGGWYSYRASKAALNMALKCLAIEWKRSAKSVRVAALHPGTTDTALSRPFQQNVPDGKLFAPEATAGYLLDCIDGLHARPGDLDEDVFLAWDGSTIPW